MSHDPAPRPPRRPRATLRMVLMAVPAVALAIVLAAGIDPFRRNLAGQAVERAIRVCSSEGFVAAFPSDPFAPDATVPAAAGAALVMFAAVDQVHVNGEAARTYGQWGALAEDGRTATGWRDSFSGGEAWGTLDASRVETVRHVLSTLPPSGWSAPADPPAWGRGDRPAEVRAVVVGFRDGGRWVTRVYDASSPPPPVAALLSILGRSGAPQGRIGISPE